MLRDSARYLEASYNSHFYEWGKPEVTLNRIQNIEDPKQRELSERLFAFASEDPAPAKQLLNVLLRETGIQFYDAGVEASVYTTKDVVLKTNRNATALSPFELRHQLKERKRETKRLSKALGHFVLMPLDISISPHPAYEEPDVVVTTQPKLVIDKRFDVFRCSLAELESAERKYPGVSDEILEFIKRSKRMIKNKNEMPDTNGRYNVVIGKLPGSVTSELYIVDLHPICVTDEYAYPRIVEQLNTTKAMIKNMEVTEAIDLTTQILTT